MEELLSTAEVVELTGKSLRTVNRWIQSGKLQPIKKFRGTSGAYVFTRSHVLEVLADNGSKGKAA